MAASVNVETCGESVFAARNAIAPRGITWLKLGNLIKADDPSPFPALTQIEVYGTDSK